MCWYISKISKGVTLLLIFIAVCCKVNSQPNLVPNASFEIYINCPIASTINKNPQPPPPWVSMQTNSFSYFNSCANSSLISPYLGVPNNFLGAYGIENYQIASLGSAYTGFGSISKNVGSYKRSYHEVKLTDSLKAGKKYNCGFYVALSNGCKYATNNIAMYITKTATTIDTVATPSWVITGNPQVYNYGNPVIKDTQNWVKISKVFVASGGEQFITIGNFKQNNQTILDTTVNPTGLDWAVYAIDDVFVTPLDSFCLKADAGRDTTITLGDSIFIGSYTNGIDSLKWLQNGVAIDSTRPGFWVKPTTATSYILQQTINGCYSADTVTIGVNPLPLRFTNYELRFTNGSSPLLGGVGGGFVLNSWQTANEINVSHFNILKSEDGPASQQGRDFKVIGKVKAQNKSINNYEFADVLAGLQSPTAWGLGYKLQSIDKDGKISYSDTRQIRLNQLTNKPINVFPNPAKDILNISCVGVKEVNILNNLGQVIKQLKVNTSMLKIDVSTIPKGLYLLKIITTENKVYNEKIIIQ